jgi:hypothetical protein
MKPKKPFLEHFLNFRRDGQRFWKACKAFDATDKVKGRTPKTSETVFYAKITIRFPAKRVCFSKRRPEI